MGDHAGGGAAVVEGGWKTMPPYHGGMGKIGGLDEQHHSKNLLELAKRRPVPRKLLEGRPEARDSKTRTGDAA